MAKQNIHYVDYPLAVALTGSVIKISFGVGDSQGENNETHTIAMPIHSFIVLSKHMQNNLADPNFLKNIMDDHSKIIDDLKR